MFENFSLWPPSASSLSGPVDALYLTLIAISVFFSVLIAAALLFFAVRYRRRPGLKATQIEGSLPLELAWTGIPFLIVVFVFAWGAQLFIEAETPPRAGMRFTVTGKQWMWKVQHPTGQAEINSLHVPVGADVVMTMISEDVIHSFYIPAFRLKQDVLPGMYTTLWFRPTQVGVYHLFCAEYCGTKHSEMIGQVVVLEPAEYQHWLEGRPADEDPVVAGALRFQNLRCDTCHPIGGEFAGVGPARGPDLAGRFGTEVALEGGATVRFDEGYVRESVLEPAKRISAGFQPQMPSYRGQVQETDLLNLIAFLKSLQPPEAPQEAGEKR
jgi:cytochrome c oxidase subunit 2